MVTKEEFNAYETVRQTGVTNMFDVFAVVKYAKKFCNVKLSKPIIIDIMHNYKDLKNEFEPSQITSASPTSKEGMELPLNPIKTGI